MKGWYVAGWLCVVLLVSDATSGRLEAFAPVMLCFTVLYIAALRNRKKIAQWANDCGGETYRQIGQRLRSSVRVWYFIAAAAIVMSVGERVGVSIEKCAPVVLLLLTIALIVFEETTAERKARKAAKRREKECGQNPEEWTPAQKRSAQEKLACGNYQSITYNERMALVSDIRAEMPEQQKVDKKRTWKHELLIGLPWLLAMVGIVCVMVVPVVRIKSGVAITKEDVAVADIVCVCLHIVAILISIKTKTIRKLYFAEVRETIRMLRQLFF